MSQYPGYPYPTYPVYPPPAPGYYAYPDPYGYPTGQPAQAPYPGTATTRHTRLPSDGNIAYSTAPSHSSREFPGNPATKKSHHRARRHTSQGLGSKEQRVLGYDASSSGAPPDVPSKVLQELAPDFLFVSLSSSDILKLTGPRESITYISDMIQGSWPGSIPSTEADGEHQIKLGRDAWSVNGEIGIRARKLVCELFVTLAQEGFRYSTTVNNHPMKAPRLVFASGPPENQPRYFMICFSLNRRTAHIINAPDDLTYKVAKSLRVVMPIRPNEGATVPARTDGWIDTGVYEVTTSVEGGRVDFANLMSGSLKFIALEGWRFEASVPFGRSGILGVRGRREAWMFRRHSDPGSDYKSRLVPNPNPNANVNINVINAKQQQLQQQQRPNGTLTNGPRGGAVNFDDRRYERDRERQRRARGGGDF